MPVSPVVVFSFTCLLFIVMGCSNATATKEQTTVTSKEMAEKFEPANGKVILFIGQELESIGGMPGYTDGYVDHFPAPGGFTQYTSLQSGTTTSGYVYGGLNGLTTTDNWGDGPENMSVAIAAPALKNACLAIGLDMAQGHDSVTAKGGHDTLIYRLGNWIKTLGRRPVFLRIGYEFDGFDWNHYRKEYYIPAFQRIRHLLDSMKVDNIAYVWQSKGAGTTMATLKAFYPGDDYVDWVAYSYFIPADSSHPMLQFARDHHKPLFIAESSTVFLDSNGTCKPLDLTRQKDVEWVWKDWFLPYFRTIHANQDVIKAIHYINAPWKTRPLWKNNNYFKNIDARITKNDSLKAWWLKETSGKMYLHASDTLFDYLWKK